MVWNSKHRAGRRNRAGNPTPVRECHRIDASTARRRAKKSVLFFARLARRAAPFDGNLAA
jgi:hypothetical protein